MKNRRTKKPRVLVAMSGGVDSSVAAALLKQKGYNVIGVTMEIWSAAAGKPTTSNNFGGCCSATAVEDAKKVAYKLRIPHYVLNFRDYFKETVIDNFISEYQIGRTPNPCIRCNQYVKFQHLLKKADELSCDLIATGHYADISKNKKIFHLKKSVDKSKDQSYVLYVMDQNALSRTIFPLGKLTKTKTRQIAKQLGLSVADKKDSQEICFVEDNNYGRFISDNIPGSIKPGPILDKEGNQMGMHRGIVYYTVGQRKGLGIPFGKPFYIIKIDRENNAIIVGEEKDTSSKELFADQVIWTSIAAPNKPFSAKAKIRYQAEEVDVKVFPISENSIQIKFKKPVRSITPGQSVVIYNKNVVLGGGIIR